MNITLSFILILLFNHKTISTFSQPINQDLILQKIAPYSDSYQVINLISENISCSVRENIAFEKSTPVFTFEIDFWRKIEKNCPLNSQSLINTLHLSLIYLYTDNLNDVRYLIDVLVECVPLYTRPKLLVLLSKNTSDLQSDYKNILEYAWMNKILDFTTLTENLKQNTSVNDSISVRYYNPFETSLVEQEYVEEMEIFPNKLKNINNYPIKIAEGYQNLNETPKWLQRGGYGITSRQNQFLVNFVFKVSGFKLEYVEFPDKLNSSIKHHHIGDHEKELWFKKTSANVLGLLLPVKDGLKNVLLMSAEKDCRAAVAFVPIKYAPTLTVSSKICFYIFIIPTSILVLILSIRLLKISLDLKVFCIIRLLFGQSITQRPQKSAGRIVFMTIIILFTFFMQDLYSDIVEINFGGKEIEFKSLEDLEKSPFKFYSILDLKFMYSSNTNPSLAKLEKKTILEIDFQAEFLCAKVMNKSSNRGCIDWEWNEESFLDVSRNFKGAVTVKMAKPALFCDNLFYRFEPASPYIEKIHNINRWIIESALIRMEYIYNNLTMHSKNKKAISSREGNDSNKIFPLLLILIAGWIIALSAFMMEFFAKYYI